MPPKHLYFNTGLIDRTLMLVFCSFSIFYVSSFLSYNFFGTAAQNFPFFVHSFDCCMHSASSEPISFRCFFCMINFFFASVFDLRAYFIAKYHFWMSIFHTKNLILFPKRQFAHYSISSCHFANCFYPFWALFCLFCTSIFFSFSPYGWRKFFFSLPALCYTISLCNVSFVFDNWP